MARKMDLREANMQRAESRELARGCSRGGTSESFPKRSRPAQQDDHPDTQRSRVDQYFMQLPWKESSSLSIMTSQKYTPESGTSHNNMQSHVQQTRMSLLSSRPHFRGPETQTLASVLRHIQSNAVGSVSERGYPKHHIEPESVQSQFHREYSSGQNLFPAHGECSLDPGRLGGTADKEKDLGTQSGSFTNSYSDEAEETLKEEKMNLLIKKRKFTEEYKDDGLKGWAERRLRTLEGEKSQFLQSEKLRKLSEERFRVLQEIQRHKDVQQSDRKTQEVDASGEIRFMSGLERQVFIERREILETQALNSEGQNERSQFLDVEDLRKLEEERLRLLQQLQQFEDVQQPDCVGIRREQNLDASGSFGFVTEKGRRKQERRGRVSEMEALEQDMHQQQKTKRKKMVVDTEIERALQMREKIRDTEDQHKGMEDVGELKLELKRVREEHRLKLVELERKIKTLDESLGIGVLKGSGGRGLEKDPFVEKGSEMRALRERESPSMSRAKVNNWSKDAEKRAPKSSNSCDFDEKPKRIDVLERVLSHPEQNEMQHRVRIGNISAKGTYKALMKKLNGHGKLIDFKMLDTGNCIASYRQNKDGKIALAQSHVKPFCGKKMVVKLVNNETDPNVAQTKVNSEGSDTPTKLDSIIVKNLPENVTVTDVCKYFASYGKVKGCKLPVKTVSIVTFEDGSIVEFILEKKDGRSLNFHETLVNVIPAEKDGLPDETKLDLVLRRSKQEQFTMRNLPDTVSVSDVSDIFSKYGRVVDCRIPLPSVSIFAYEDFMPGRALRKEYNVLPASCNFKIQGRTPRIYDFEEEDGEEEIESQFKFNALGEPIATSTPPSSLKGEEKHTQPQVSDQLDKLQSQASVLGGATAVSEPSGNPAHPVEGPSSSALRQEVEKGPYNGPWRRPFNSIVERPPIILDRQMSGKGWTASVNRNRKQNRKRGKRKPRAKKRK